MRLENVIGTHQKYDFNQIQADSELSSEIQQKLIEAGLLNVNIESTFGVLSRAALKRFQELNNCKEPESLGVKTAQKLIEIGQGKPPAAAMSFPVITLRVIKDTLLKTRPLQSTVLSDKEKYPIKAGTQLNITIFEVQRDHVKVTLSDEPIQNSRVWFLYGLHITIFEGNKQVYPTAQRPEKVQLDVPYKSQMDNMECPTGTCNVTSIAMGLEYLKIPRHQTSGQFEDELYDYALDKGLDRHSPQDLAQIVNDYGGKDNFSENATTNQVKDWLAKGNPAVTHGYFTQSGHVIALVGYDSAGFIVHDPYGEWYADGYDVNDPDGNNKKGRFQHYSYQMIQDTCMSDGQFWVHFISK
jgi:uncharacterized protein YvpB